MEQSEASVRPERILELADRLNVVAGAKIGEIGEVNRAAKMLAINALIVAARAGDAGKSFAIVAQEFKKISDEIDSIAADLTSQVGADLKELSHIGAVILGHLSGQRLADLSLNAIEIIDRNLYERTCDVRWWATDSAVVDCAAEPSPERSRHASQRLRVILDAYTVYLDLWICDPNGKVIATGRPDRYPTAKSANCATAPWFRGAMGTATGDDFTASDVATVQSLDGAPVATYATAIREGGRANGKIIGVLGIHFDWRPQAQAVVNGVRLTEEERARSRVLLLDSNHRVIASSDGRGMLSETFPLSTGGSDMGCYASEDTTVGFALTPGYETYKGMGWFGVVVQKKAAKSVEELSQDEAQMRLRRKA